MSVSASSDPSGSSSLSSGVPAEGGTGTPATAVAEPTVASDPSGAPIYAIVDTGGQQVWLQPNRYLDLDRLDAAVDSTITLDTVLLLKDAKGTTLGQPYVEGARVELTVLAHRRGPKILVYKMRRKKKTRRKTGHRQELTRVLVRAIHGGG